MRVILIEQIDVFDLGLILHEGGQRFHFHGGVSVKAEVPVVAFLVGQRRVHRGIVQKDNFFSRVALVMLGNRIGQCQSRARAIALGDVAVALVDGRFKGVQAFLRRAFVVETVHFKFDASSVLGTAKAFCDKLPALELVLPHIGKWARQGVNEGDFDCLPRRWAGTGCGRLCLSKYGRSPHQHYADSYAIDSNFEAGWKSMIHSEAPVFGMGRAYKFCRQARLGIDPRRYRLSDFP